MSWASAGGHPPGVDPISPGPAEKERGVFRRMLGEALGANDVGPARSATCSAELRGGPHAQRGLCARDPGSHVAHWCWGGAPAGIAADCILDELFPAADGDGDEVLARGDLAGPAEYFAK
ncbi:unnamed protein product [Prorocentrum cordatum]|uniref:Uncharacterized protein n=1 Tax=Prorocentrum cordatum TaxID=2364126 RepID=A0ABN9R4A4_9DINO|nr:unnamed protein product [Polarella glacialis]